MYRERAIKSLIIDYAVNAGFDTHDIMRLQAKLDTNRMIKQAEFQSEHRACDFAYLIFKQSATEAGIIYE